MEHTNAALLPRTIDDETIRHDGNKTAVLTLLTTLLIFLMMLIRYYQKCCTRPRAPFPSRSAATTKTTHSWRVTKPALRTIGNIVCAEDDTDYTQHIIDAGAVPCLQQLIAHSNREIQKEVGVSCACCAYSSIYRVPATTSISPKKGKKLGFGHLFFGI